MKTAHNTVRPIVDTLALILLAAISWLGYRHLADNDRSGDNPVITVTEIKQIVNLCTMEIHEEIPVKASIGHRHIFAKETLVGSIAFDLEKAKVEFSGDTISVILPPEKIELMESNEDGAYEVLDTWNDRLFASRHFTTAEENLIKFHNAAVKCHGGAFVR